MDVLDADKSGTIEYTELMNGSSMVNKEKEKIARAKREKEIMAESAAQKKAKDLEHKAQIAAAIAAQNETSATV